MKYQKQKENQKGLYYCIRNEREGKGAATATMPRPPHYHRGLSHETNAGERWANMSQTTEEGWRVAAMV